MWTPAAGQGPYSISEVRSLEDDHRDHCTRAESETLCAHFLIVDGEYSSENVVGITHYESMAFFDETINDISGGWSLAATVPPFRTVRPS